MKELFALYSSYWLIIFDHCNMLGRLIDLFELFWAKVVWQVSKIVRNTLTTHTAFLDRNGTLTKSVQENEVTLRGQNRPLKCCQSYGLPLKGDTYLFLQFYWMASGFASCYWSRILNFCFGYILPICFIIPSSKKSHPTFEKSKTQNQKQR